MPDEHVLKDELSIEYWVGLPTQSRVTIERFIELLTGSPNTPMCWRFLPDSAAEKAKVAAFEKTQRTAANPKWCLQRNFDGALGDVWDNLVAHQNQNWGIFAVVNSGGRNADAILKNGRVRAIYIDMDGKELASIKWHIEPSFIVKRSETRWHAYWLVDDLSVNDFELAQLRLIAYYGSDSVVHDLPRVMRAPGTLHTKTTPCSVELIERHGAARRPAVELLEGLPDLDGELVKKVRERQERNTACAETVIPDNLVVDRPHMIARAKAEIARAVDAGNVSREGIDGNTRLFSIACILKEFAISEPTASEILWDHFNPHCIPPWSSIDDVTFETPIKSAYANTKIVFGKWYVGTAEETFSAAKACETGAIIWPEEEPLDPFSDGVIEEPVFHRDMVPTVIGDYAFDTAELIGATPAMVALPLIVCGGVALGNKHAIQPTLDPNYLERPNLWGALVSGSGSGKSPAIQLGTDTLGVARGGECGREQWRIMLNFSPTMKLGMQQSLTRLVCGYCRCGST